MLKIFVHLMLAAYVGYVSLTLYQIAVFEKTEAEYVKLGTQSTNSSGGVGGGSVMYTIIYTYRVNGIVYSNESRIKGGANYQRGDKFALFYNPQDPYQHILISMYGFLGELLFGIVGFLIFYFLLYKAPKLIHNKKINRNLRKNSSLDM